MKKTYSLLLLMTSLVMANAQNTLDFDGTNDYVDMGNDTSLQISGKYITLEAWIYPTSWKTNAYDGNIIAKEYNTSNYGYMLRCGAGGKLNFALGDGSWHEITTSSTVLSLNTWQHVAGTFDGSMMRLYLNGAAIDSLSFNGNISKTSSNNLYIGAHLTYSRYYQGQIDEVKIWNICRTQSEISNGMNNEFCSKQTGLVGYYKFNQGKAGQNNPNVKKLNDLSGKGNNGTLYNFGLNGTSSNWIKGKNFIKSVSNASDTIDVCNGYISPSRRFTWTKSGTYQDTIPTYFFGCDSAITIHLTIRKASTYTFSVHACDSFISPSGNAVWKTSGTYVEKLKNLAGCDSTVTVHLSIGGNRDTIYPVTCDSYTVPSGKYIHTVSGNYFDTLVDYRNCDSIIDIRLTVNKSKYATHDLSGCSVVYSPSLRYTYVSNGVYYDTLKTKTGCDSFLTLNVRLKNTSATVTATSCGSYTSPDNRNTFTQSGTYIDTMTNMAFCDSFITYNITILKPSTSSIVVRSCGPYRSPSNRYLWKTSGTYTDTLNNHVGCDSVVTVTLDIPVINTSVNQSGKTLTAQSSVGTFRWLDCNANYAFISGATNHVYTATAIGHYAVEVNDNNCLDTSICYFVSSVNIQDIRSDAGLKLSPNPSNGAIDVETTVPLGKTTIRVYDLSGRLLFETDYESFQKEHLELSLSAGGYLLELIAEAYHAMSFLSVE